MSGTAASKPKRDLTGLSGIALRIVDDPRTNRFVVTAIVANAIALGLETMPWFQANVGELLDVLDRVFIGIFLVEIALKITAASWQFFRDPWNIFDSIVIGIALVPSAGPLTVLRALRILRVLRIISRMRALRRVVAALGAAIPGMASIAGLLTLLFYVGSVIATSVFGNRFEEWFGSIGASAYSLFQIMTLESWSHGIVRPVMEEYPSAWIFFVPFILLTSFTVLNLFIAVIVDSMAAIKEDEAAEPVPEITEDPKPDSADLFDRRSDGLADAVALSRAVELNGADSDRLRDLARALEEQSVGLYQILNQSASGDGRVSSTQPHSAPTANIRPGSSNE